MARAGAGAAALAATPGAIAGPFDPAAATDHAVPADKKLDPAWVRGLFARGERTWHTGRDLEIIGIPVGGVCAGQLYLAGDGRLAYWGMLMPNYDTGWGANNYRAGRKPGEIPAERGKSFTAPPHVDNGFAVRVESGGQTVTRTLDARGFASVRFAGEYPIARVEYSDPAVPLAVQLEAFSPFIPLSAEDSALPATVLEYTLTNTGAAKAKVTLTGWLENGVCPRSGPQLGGGARRLNRRLDTRHAAGFVAAVERTPLAPRTPARPAILLADFEGPTYGEWKATGAAFGTGPAKGTLPGQQKVDGFEGAGLVNTFLGGDDPHGRLVSPPFTIERAFLAFLIGGGSLAGRTCINLLVDGKAVRTQTGVSHERLLPRAWDVRDLEGKRAVLEIVDAQSGPWGHINVDRIEQRDDPPPGADAALLRPPDDGTLALAVLGDGDVRLALPDGRPASAADREGEPPGEPEGNHRHGSAGASPSHAGEDRVFAAGDPDDAKAERRAMDEKLTGAAGSTFTLKPGETRRVAFVVAWHFPNLFQHPAWVGQEDGFAGRHYAGRFADAGAVATYVAANHERLAGATRLWHRTYYDSTLPHWLLDRIGATTCNLATNTCQWWANGRFWAWEGVGCCHGTCGHVWNYAHALARLFPSLERSARELQDFKPGAGFREGTGEILFRGSGSPWAGDAQAGYILKALREHQCSADGAFLARVWPRVRQAMQFLIGQDGNADGLLEGKQHNTYDIDFYGANTMVGSLYLAALRAAEELAREAGDAEFAATCRRIFEAGSAASMKRLFNGEYFFQDPEQVKAHEWQYGEGCLADQLFGQGWAHQVGLGYIYPREAVRAALASVWKYGWAPDVAPQNKLHAPERWFAYPGEGGLFTCTWPRGPHGGPKSVRYRDEVWTGIEYQVANHMAWEGLLDEALVMCRTVHDRYHPSKRNPYNEMECGDHYARALAAWGVLTGLAGFEYHGPRGHLGFAPRMSPENFRSVFTAAEGWGTLDQQQTAGRQTNTVTVRHGTLRLRTFALELPEGQSAPRVEAARDGRALAAKADIQGCRLTLTFDRELTLAADQALTVKLTLR